MHDTHQVMAHVVFYVQAYKVVPVRNLTLRIQNVYGVEVYYTHSWASLLSGNGWSHSCYGRQPPLDVG